MVLINFHQFIVRLRLNTKVAILGFLFQFDNSSSITFWNVTLPSFLWLRRQMYFQLKKGEEKRKECPDEKNRIPHVKKNRKIVVK